MANTTSDPQVFYLTDNFQPTDEANADLVKLIYADGRIVFGIPKDEAQAELGGKGSGFYGHAGRDAENERGGSLPRDVQRIQDVMDYFNFPASRVVLEKENLPDGTIAQLQRDDGLIHIFPDIYKEEMFSIESTMAHEIAHARTVGDYGMQIFEQPFIDAIGQDTFEERGFGYMRSLTPFTNYLWDVTDVFIHNRLVQGQSPYYGMVLAEAYAELSRLDYEGKLNNSSSAGGVDVGRHWTAFYDGVNKAIKAGGKYDFGGKGSGFHGHKGRDAENLRGGSVKRDAAVPKGYKATGEGRFFIKSDAQHVKGHFDSMRVHILNDGDAIIKSNSVSQEDEDYGGFGDEGIIEGLAQRDVVTYELDKALGLGVVPKTVPIKVNGKYASMQDWVQNSELGYSLASDKVIEPDDAAKILLLDIIGENWDRKPANWLHTDDGRLVAIDNSLMFTYNETVPDITHVTRTIAAFGGRYPNDGQRNWYLPSEYKDRLGTILKDGTFSKIMNGIRPLDGSKTELATTAEWRANWVYDNWDELFRSEL